MRNLKVLGLALVAVFAMSAVVASTATAQFSGKFTAKEYPAHIVGADTGFNAFTALGGQVECEGATYTAESNEASTELTVTPNYGEECEEAINERPATVTMNGCDYVFHLGTGTGGTPEDWHGTVDVVCPTKPIEVHIYQKGDTGHSFSICTLTVGSQNGLSGVTYTDSNANSVTVEGTIPVATQTHGLCTAGVTTNINTEYHAKVTVEGTGENSIDIG